MTADSIHQHGPLHQKDDKVFTVVRYGQQSIFTEANDPKKPLAFEAGAKLADLLPFYDRLIEAIEKGELDDKIASVQASMSKRRGK